jgi:4-hydroxy-tetrahydrodipicolinate synthase
MARDIGRHLAAVIAPFMPDFAINEASFRAVCRHVMDMPGIDGIVVNAHASEVDALDAEERTLLARLAAEEAHARNKTAISGVLPQPGSYPTAIAMARAAEKAGVDAILLMGPASFGRGIDAMPEIAAEYTRAVTASISIPVIYFTAGAISGINYTPEVVRCIASVDGVVAVKDTMWTPQGFDANLKILRRLGRGTRVLTGNDNCVFQNFVSGADGTLLVLHCALGRELCEMYDLVAANDVRRAKELNDRIEPLIELLFARPMLKMPARIKHVLRLRGVVPNGVTRAPVPALEQGEAAAIAAEVSKLDGRNTV